MLSIATDASLAWRPLFLAAGVWNIATGLAYLGLRQRIASRYGIGAGQNGDPSDRILANLVHLYFGVIAFWIAHDPARDVHLIMLWIACKLTSVGLAAIRFRRTQRSDRSLITLGPAATDVVWSIVFLVCLTDLLQHQIPA